MLFFIRCEYRPHATARREAAREEHLAYLRANGHRLRFAGPGLDDDGAPNAMIAVLGATDRAEALAYLEGEAFHRAGMFDRIEVTRFASLLGRRQVELREDPERRLYIAQYRLADEGARALHVPSEEDGVRLLEAGPLLDDAAARVLGGLLFLEAGGRDAATAFLDDVLGESRPVAEQRLTRWRFGKAIGSASSQS